MIAISLMVTEKTAREIQRLAETGHLPGRAHDSYVLALSTRPLAGDRWVKIGNADWMRLPKRLTCGD